MGILDHSTNNVLLDAVLTDKGRELLSKNDGSFSIVKFALGDDEVDYGIIKKYGRTVGKEKIEKNTPVFEASTNGSLGQKYKAISVSNPTLLRIPNVELTSGATTGVVALGTGTNTTKSVTVEQKIVGESSIDVELIDQAFLVELNELFLQIVGLGAPDDRDPTSRRAMYLLTRTGTNTGSGGGAKLTFTLQVKSLTDTQFTVFGTKGDKTKIRTFVKVSGLQSGAVVEFPVEITKNL